MPRKPDSRIEQAKEMFLNGMKLVEIASQLELPEGTVRRWKSTHNWDNERSEKKSERSEKKKGGQPGNRNAEGHGGTGPPGNKNAVKHGAYETIYLEALPEEERSLFDSIPDSDDLDGEIRLLRMKLSRLLGRGNIKTYDMFGAEHERAITEAEREKGILEVTAEIRKLVKTKKQIQLAEIKANPDDGTGDAIAENMQSLAEILQHSRPNRNIEDYEEGAK